MNFENLRENRVWAYFDGNGNSVGYECYGDNDVLARVTSTYRSSPRELFEAGSDAFQDDFGTRDDIGFLFDVCEVPDDVAEAVPAPVGEIVILLPKGADVADAVGATLELLGQDE